jgi:microcystin-dependent protein
VPRTKAKAVFDEGVQIPPGAAAGAVLLSDGSGNGSWGTPNQLVYDSDPIGTVKAYAGATIPLNWMVADGRSLLRTDYPQLFTALGGASSPWGLPDSTHFNIPDLLSRMMVGAGAGVGLSARALATAGGEEKHLLTTAELPAHAHASAAHAHNYSNGTGKVPTNTIGFTRVNVTHGTGAFNNNFPVYSGAGVDANDSATDSTTPGNTGNAGSGTTHENMPPWCAIAYIIKVTGVAINAGGALVGATGPAGAPGTPAAPLALDTWHLVGTAGEPAYNSLWKSYAGGFPLVGFTKDPFGRVQLKGLLGATGNIAAGTTIFTLPAGYWPQTSVLLDTSINGVNGCRIDVNAAGVVTLNTSAVAMTATGYITLDHLWFDTETVTSFPSGPKGDPGATGPAFTTANEGAGDFSVTGGNYVVPNAAWGTPGWFAPIVVGPSQIWEVVCFAPIYCVTAVHGVIQRGGVLNSSGGAAPAGVAIVDRRTNNLPALTTGYSYSVATRLTTDATVPANTTLRLTQEFNGAGANGRILRDGSYYFTHAWRRV